MKKFVALLFSALLLGTAGIKSQTTDKPILRIGLIADIQYSNAESVAAKEYSKSLVKLEEAVKQINEKEVLFTLNLGDLTDRNPAELDDVMKGLKNLDKKAYNTPGNHDYKGIVDNNMMFKKMGMPDEYYSFAKNKWRFILLNTNEVASYANIEASNKAQELKDMQTSIAEREGKNDKPYNGGISKRQMEWLKDQLAQAEKKKENVVIGTHHPLYPESSLTALNATEILEVLAKSPAVKLVVSGHNHAGAFDTYEGIPCLTVKGMLEAENNAFAVAEFYENRIVVQGFGDMKDVTMEVR